MNFEIIEGNYKIIYLNVKYKNGHYKRKISLDIFNLSVVIALIIVTGPNQTTGTMLYLAFRGFKIN